MKMLYLQVTVIVLHFSCLHPLFVEEYWITFHESMSGVGDIVANVNGTSTISCGHECCSRANYTAANYFHSNRTCTLLHVEDVMDDWVGADEDVTFICIDCQPGPEGLLRSQFNKILHILHIFNNMNL